MDPNEPKDYNHQFMPQMGYPGEYGGYMPTDYQQMPPQPIPGMPMGASAQMRNPYMGQPQPQVPYPTTPQQNSSTIKIKGKRRSKNETEGRNYKCSQCERTYLSYPALYTHIKTKHSVQGEAPMTSGRGRGRPKKSLTREQRVDPTSVLYFRTEEHKGGPTAVIYKFKDAYDILFSSVKKYNSFENHKLYVELYKLHIKNVAIHNYSHEHPGCTDFGPTPAGLPPAIYTLKSEEPDKTQSPDASKANPNPTPESNSDDKKKKKCDEVFAEYLDSVAKETNKECYLNVLKFVFLYRECLNHYGEKLSKGKEGMISPGEQNLRNDEGKEEYCIMNNAEQAPEVSNEFVTIYLEEVKTNFGTMDPIELTQNFCGWLFGNGYTCSKLSLIQDNQ